MELSEHDELLISRYADGESGFFEARRVRRLLAANAEAEAFLGSLRRIGGEVSDSSRFELRIDLCERIERRIDQEERAALYLGARESTRRGDRREVFSAWEALLGRGLWGMSGALAAVLLMFFFGESSNMRQAPPMLGEQLAMVESSGMSAMSADESIPQLGEDTSNQEEAVRMLLQEEALRNQGRSAPLDAPVATVSQGSGADRRSAGVRRYVEMDWMRSDGRVRLVQVPNRGSSIIWVTVPPGEE